MIKNYILINKIILYKLFKYIKLSCKLYALFFLIIICLLFLIYQIKNNIV